MDPYVVESIMLVGIGVVAGALLVGVAWFVSRRRRGDSYSRHLRKRYGREYEQALAEHGSRHEAELDLIAREQRARELTLRPLRPAEVERFLTRWNAIQRTFVDEPGNALRGAHELLETLMAELGYPTGSQREEIELVSVHHPEAVHHYREALRLHRERDQGEATTETRRQALIHYRELFAELLDEPTAGHDAHHLDDDGRAHARP